jgi:hypothetical protein
VIVRLEIGRGDFYAEIAILDHARPEIAHQRQHRAAGGGEVNAIDEFTSLLDSVPVAVISVINSTALAIPGSMGVLFRWQSFRPGHLPRLRQFGKKGLRVLQILGVEPLGEPAVNRGE